MLTKKTNMKNLLASTQDIYKEICLFIHALYNEQYLHGLNFIKSLFHSTTV